MSPYMSLMMEEVTIVVYHLFLQSDYIILTENISQKLGTADNHGQKVKDNLVDAKSKDNILATLQCDGNSKVGTSTPYYYLLQHSSSYLH